MQSSSVGVTTADGVADAHLTRPDSNDAPPAVLFIMDAIGLWRRIEEMADYVAHQGYVVLAPNVLFRAGRARVLALPDLSDADDLRCSLDGGADFSGDLELPSGPPGVGERDE